MTSTLRTRVALATASLFLAGTTGLSIAAAASGASAVAASTASTVTLGQSAAEKKPKAKKYKNCTALHKVYEHGVGKKGAKDKVKGKAKPVKNFTVDTKTYNLNKKSDRDKDGVACEKK